MFCVGHIGESQLRKYQHAAHASRYCLPWHTLLVRIKVSFLQSPALLTRLTRERVQQDEGCPDALQNQVARDAHHQPKDAND